MKVVKWLIGIFVALIIVIGLVVAFGLGAAIKTGVETVGPVVTGVPVTLEKASVSPMRGEAKLKGLIVGNPEGFKTPSMFELNDLKVKLTIQSVLSDEIQIESIQIDGPMITYEQGLKGNNITALMKQIEENLGTDDSDTEEEGDSEGGKKVVIDEVIISNAKVRLSITGLGGKAAGMPLPTITLKDIGKETGGVTFAEAIGEIVSAVLHGVTGVVASTGKRVGEGVVAVGEGALAVGGGVVDGVGAVGEEALKGAGAAAGVATDVVKGTGKVVGSGAKKLIGGVTGFLKKGGGSSEEASSDAETSAAE